MMVAVHYYFSIFFDAVIIVILSAVLLHERVPPGRLVASVIGLSGVLLIVQPGFGNFQWASLLALAAAEIGAHQQVEPCGLLQLGRRMIAKIVNGNAVECHVQRPFHRA